MTVGEARIATLRQRPILSWSPTPFKLVFTSNQACRFELEKVLTRANRSHTKTQAYIGGGLRTARLQVEQDAILTAALVLTHEAILETVSFLK